MEHSEAAFDPATDEPQVIYPPKYEKTEGAVSNSWMRSLASLAVYLFLGYYVFQSFTMLLVITAIVIIHEMGHFLAMKYYGYKDLGIFFIPLLGAYVSGSKREVSQRESAIILLAGPMPGIIFGAVLYLVFKQNPYIEFWGVSLYTISMMFILLNLINLLPVYPLDGGQLLNRVFLDEVSWLSKAFVLLSIAALTWFALFGTERPIYILLIFPAMMLFRLWGDNSMNKVEKKIGEEGLDMDKSYEDLTDEEYWKIRAVLISEQASFRDTDPGPPYEYSRQEEKIMLMIKSLLHRHLLQDLPIAGKLLVFVVWAAGIASPWLINADLGFLRYFGL